MTIDQKGQNELRSYLLSRLDEAAEEAVENRLLSDPDYLEELNILTEELIDQYAHDQVSAEERHQVEEFILQSSQRRSRLRFALALKQRAAEVRKQKHRRTRVLKFYLPIAASVVVAAGLGVWWLFFHATDVDRGLVALRKAYRDQRPVASRVTDFDYAPVLRGTETVDSLQRTLATSLLTSAAIEHPDAKSHAALGQFYITEHQFDRAAAELQASLALDPSNAKVHNDLGVALLELGQKAEVNNDPGQGLKYFAQSHDHLNRALELNGSLLEARFNIALVLERMGLPHQAEESWKKYLEKDSTSKWANEARENLRVLEERKPKASTEDQGQPLEDFLKAYQSRNEDAAWQVLGSNREVVSGKFIPLRLVDAYLESANNGLKENAANMQGALDYAGELEARKGGDLYTREVARFYRSVSPNKLSTVAKAQKLANEAYELCRLSGFEKAVVLFEEARSLFESTDNKVESAFVGYWLAFSYRYSQRVDESRAISEELIRYCKQKKYKWLLAQLLGLQSNIQTGLHEQSAVINLSAEALSLTQQVNDAYGTQKYLASLAGKYSVLYNFNDSLDHLARCLRKLDTFWPGTRQAWRNYDTATQVFNRLGLYSASAAYGEEALKLALKEPTDPSIIYLSYVHLGMAYGRLERYAEGIRHAQSGFAIGQSLEGGAGTEIMAYSALQLGELNRQRGDLDEAANRYDQSIELYNQLSFHTFKFVAHKGRLLTYLAQGNDSAVEVELKVLQDLFEEYRLKIKEEENRTYFFDAAQDVYDVAIDFFQSRRKNKEAAFWYSEDSRARSLLVTMLAESPSDSTPLAQKPYDVEAIRRRMPEEMQILQYAVLSDKLLVWVISRDDFWVHEQPLSSHALDEQVRNYLKLISRPSSSEDDVRQASVALYDILFEPIKDRVIAGKKLCIVPDKVLNHLPFPALFSSKSGRYLIEDYTIIFSPSSSVFIVNTEAARDRSAPDGEKLLSVGNPDFDRKAFASLPDLPSAASEAETIARFYSAFPPSVLTFDEAQKEAVTAAMRDSDVLHFASHYVVDERLPMRSQLLLAKPNKNDKNFGSSEGSLFASDIYNMKLQRPRLAVLSACSTGVERYYRGEGMIGMARTFLAAGVPVVVATQWPTDTVASSGLMSKFHEYRGSLYTADALRKAQIQLLGDSSHPYRHPYYWAPFVVIGGQADF